MKLWIIVRSCDLPQPLRPARMLRRCRVWSRASRIDNRQRTERSSLQSHNDVGTVLLRCKTLLRLHGCSVAKAPRIPRQRLGQCWAKNPMTSPCLFQAGYLRLHANFGLRRKCERKAKGTFYISPFGSGQHREVSRRTRIRWP